LIALIIFMLPSNYDNNGKQLWIARCRGPDDSDFRYAIMETKKEKFSLPEKVRFATTLITIRNHLDQMNPARWLNVNICLATNRP
jgi:hypothetical protein